MPVLVPSIAVEEVVRDVLRAQGWEVSAPRAHGETGVDIEARRDGQRLFVEAISFKSSPPARAKDFYEAFFRAASRSGPEMPRLALALPLRFEAGLPRRARALGHAWIRIGQAFPELEIWLVDVAGRDLRETRWAHWAPQDEDAWPITASTT